MFYRSNNNISYTYLHKNEVSLSHFTGAEVPVAAMPAAQNPLEGLPKLRVEDGVNDWIERRVEVAEPEGKAHDVIANDAGVAAQGHQERQDEEGQPTHDESSSYDGQRFRSFALPLRLQALLFLASGRD